MGKLPDDWNRKKGTYPNSTLDAVAEDKVLTDALVVALRDDVGLTELIEALEHIDPNVLRAHSCGTGNALHQAIRWVYVHSTKSHEQLGAVISVLVENGASVDQPCEDFDGGVFKSRHHNILSWIENKHANCITTSSALLWEDVVLPALLSAGAGWGQLDQREGPLGDIVRAHPAWRREQLGTYTGIGTAGTPEGEDGLMKNKPKI